MSGRLIEMVIWTGLTVSESTNTYNLEQYGKMNIVISGIPDKVRSNDLENTIDSFK